MISKLIYFTYFRTYDVSCGIQLIKNSICIVFSKNTVWLFLIKPLGFSLKDKEPHHTEVVNVNTYKQREFLLTDKSDCMDYCFIA